MPLLTHKHLDFSPVKLRFLAVSVAMITHEMPQTSWLTHMHNIYEVLCIEHVWHNVGVEGGDDRKLPPYIYRRGVIFKVGIA